jgi:hypothetical protein
MADLPELPESTKRKLEVQYDALLDKYRLTGEHFHWHDEQRDALSRGGKVGPLGGWRGPHGSYRVNERLIDREGIAPSVAIAKERFYHLAVAYWGLWSPSAGYEIFTGWLQILKGQVLAEIASIWKGKSDAIDSWYDRTCASAVEKALLPKVKEFRGWAHNAELKQLQQATTTELLQRLERVAEGKSDPGVEHLFKASLEEPRDASPEDANSEAQPPPATNAEALKGTTPGIVEETIAHSDRTWRNLPPDDPRFKTWQLIRGVLQRNESQARAACIADYEANGLQSALLTLVVQQFDSFGDTSVKLVTNVASAEKTGQLLNEALELTLDHYTPSFQEIERRFRIPSARLLKESRFRLTARLEHWKAEAFRFGIEGEMRAQTERATDATVRMEAETQPASVVNGANDNGINRRAAVDGYISKLAEAGHKITRKSIWTVAGYTQRTEFERFQRGDPRTTRSAESNFNRVLGMKPEDFVLALQKRKTPK